MVAAGLLAGLKGPIALKSRLAAFYDRCARWAELPLIQIKASLRLSLKSCTGPFAPAIESP